MSGNQVGAPRHSGIAAGLIACIVMMMVGATSAHATTVSSVTCPTGWAPSTGYLNRIFAGGTADTIADCSLNSSTPYKAETLTTALSFPAGSTIYLESGFTVGSGGSLTIQGGDPGAGGQTLFWANGSVGHGTPALFVTSGGSLTITGTTNDSSVVLDAGPFATYESEWEGIGIRPGGTANLTDFTLKDAGASMPNGPNTATFNAGILSEGTTSTLTIGNATISTNGGDGIEAITSSVPKLTGAISITNNDSYAVAFDAFRADLSNLSGTLSASGNNSGTGDYINVPGSGTITGSYPNTGIPYNLNGAVTVNTSVSGKTASLNLGSGTAAEPATLGGDLTVGTAGALTVPAGSTVNTGGNAIYVKGTLTSGSSGGANVLLTVTAGYWKGIGVRPGGQASFTNTTFQYAGTGVTNAAANATYNAAVLAEGATSAVSFSGCTFTNDYLYGVEAISNALPTFSGSNTFMSNGASAIVFDALRPSISSAFTGTLSGDNNQNSRIEFLAGGTLTGAYPDVGFPYLFDGALTVGNATTAGSLTLASHQSAAPAAFSGGDLTVGPQGTVTVPAGSTVNTNGYGIYVKSGGTLTAAGTSASPAVINDGGNYWRGIAFQPGSTGSLMYTTLGGAGEGVTNSAGSVTYQAAVLVEGSASVTLTNDTFKNDYIYGIESISGGNPTLSGADSFTGGTAPIHYDTNPPDSSHLDGATLTSTGATSNRIQLGGGPISGTYNVQSLPYEIWGATTVASGGSVTLANDATGTEPLLSGADLTVAAGGSVTVSPGTTVQSAVGAIRVAGTLNAIATGSSTITFQPAAGFSTWPGIDFYPGSTGNLSGVTVSKGAEGMYNSDSSQYIQAGILAEGNTSLTLNNTTVSNVASNGGYGLFSLNGASPVMTGTDTFTGNGTAALYFSTTPASLTGITGTLTMTGNGDSNDIQLGSGTITGTLPDLGYSYDASGTITVDGAMTVASHGSSPAKFAGGALVVGNGGTVTVPAGSTVKFSGSGITVQNGGTLNVPGTSAQKVLLTTLDTSPGKGQWYGVYFQPGSTGNVSYLTEQDAGSGLYDSTSTAYFQTGFLIEGASSNVNLSYSTINTSEGDDVDVESGALPTLKYDTFSAPGSSVNYGVQNYGYTSGTLVDATKDYWGVAGGPTVPNGPTKGSAVSVGVNTSPFLGVAFGTYKPSISIVPSSGPVGSSVQVSGSGFGPNDPIAILLPCSTFQCSGGTTLGTVTADSSGNLPATTVTLPPASFGSQPVGALQTAKSAYAFATSNVSITASLSATPSTGTKGATPTFSGAGFAASEPVTLYWDCAGAPCSGTGFGTGTSDSTGNLTITSAALPGGVYGAHQVTAIGTQSGAVATTTVNIQAALSTATPNAGPGSSVAVTGSGFGSGDTVTLTWNCAAPGCSGTTLGTVTAGSDGSISTSITVPTDTFGPHSIGATGSPSTAFATTSLAVVGTINSTPSSGKVGAGITVTGKGFGPNEQVSIGLDCPSGGTCASTLSPATSDSSGSFSQAETVPAAAYGSHSLVATGPSGATAPTTFSVVPNTTSSAPVVVVGGADTLTATGFEAGKTITVKWNCATPSCTSASATTWTGTTDANGGASVPITIPNAPQGTHKIVAYTSSTVFTVVSVTVRPTVKGSKTSGYVGDSVIFRATGYPANAAISVYWNCSAYACSTALPSVSGTTNTLGTFSGTLTIPAATAGTYSVAGQVSSTAFSKTTFAIKAKIVIAPTSGVMGSSATVTGTGFGASKSIAIRWACGASSCTSTPIATGGTDGSGNLINGGGTAGIPITIPSKQTVGKSYFLTAKDSSTTPLWATTTYTVTG